MTRFWRGSRLRPPGGSGEPAEPKSNATARCGNGLHRRPPGRGGGGPCRRCGSQRRLGEARRRPRRRDVRRDGSCRPPADGDRRSLQAERGGRHPGQAAPRPDHPERTRREVARRARGVSVPAAGDRGGSREPGALRVVRIRGRPGLSRGQAVRDRQRAQPAGVLAPPVHALGHERLRGDVRAVPRGRVRLPERDRLGNPGRRDRALTARERQAECEEQRLDVAGALRARARRLVPRKRPHPPADGRLQLPSVPEQGNRSARARVRMAERRLREPRPRQAGALGRVRRHRAADDAERPDDSTWTRSDGRSTPRGSRAIRDERTSPSRTS